MDDLQKISAEFQRRHVQSFTLAAEGSLVGSAFFPLSSGQIREVVFFTSNAGKTEELRVALIISQHPLCRSRELCRMKGSVGRGEAA